MTRGGGEKRACGECENPLESGRTFFIRPRVARATESLFPALNAMPTSEFASSKRFDRVAFASRPTARALVLFLTVCVASVFSGCQTTKKVDLPKVVAEDATTPELCAAINANGEKIQSIYATNASIGVRNQPGWANCRLFFERPDKLRLVGTASIVGRVVDCGCDGEQFWFWSSFQNADELYYCKLDQYNDSSLSRVIPIDPTWFPEAFGVVSIQEDDVEDRSTSDGMILLTVKKKRADGVYRKRVYVEPRTAAIARQDVQNPSGETVISVVVKEQQYVKDPGVVMPRKLEIRCETTNETLIVDVGTPTLNDSSKLETAVFQRPTDIKATAVDVGASAASQNQASAEPATPATNFQAVRVETPGAQFAQNDQTPSSDQATSNDADAKAAVEQVALEQPTLAENESNASSGTGVVPFPSSVASTPPSDSTASNVAAAPIAIQPTKIASASAYAVVPDSGPEKLPVSDSTFARRIFDSRELQEAQSAISGVPLQPSTTANVGASRTPAGTNLGATNAASSTSNAATSNLDGASLGFGAAASANARVVANSGSVSSVPTTSALQNSTLQASPSVPEPPVAEEDLGASDDQSSLLDEFPAELPF